jgi:hypothetical protein
MHWDAKRLAWLIDVMQDEGLGLFARVRDTDRRFAAQHR